MKNFFNEFKKFISRGNVMDMAVGIIIGGAFTSIVTSLVNDIINPILGVFGGMNFDQLSVKLFGEATLYYGKFLTAVVNFLIMALIVFCIVKAIRVPDAAGGCRRAGNLGHVGDIVPHSQVVQVIGKKIVLYKPDKENPKIVLP